MPIFKEIATSFPKWRRIQKTFTRADLLHDCVYILSVLSIIARAGSARTPRTTAPPSLPSPFRSMLRWLVPPATERRRSPWHDPIRDGGLAARSASAHSRRLLFNLARRRASHVDHGHAAGELRTSGTVVSRGRSPSCFLDLALDLLNAAHDVGWLAGTLDDHGVSLSITHALRATKIFDFTFFSLIARSSSSNLPPRQESRYHRSSPRHPGARKTDGATL